ncbi:MAG: RNA-binding protein, partial [bacterium]
KKFVRADKIILEQPMRLEGRLVRGAKVKILSDTKISLIITEGINRQIRKMLEQVGYKVVDLQRIRLGKLKLTNLNLKEGQYKEILPADVI